MPGARTVAGVCAFCKFATRIGTPFVNAASDRTTDLTGQGSAAVGDMIGAAHAAGVAVEINIEPGQVHHVFPWAGAFSAGPRMIDHGARALGRALGSL